MIIKEKMKNMKIYRTPLFLPTVDGNKKKYSALIMASPSYEVSKKIMTHPLLLNRKRYESYYLHRDVSYYIGSNNKVDALNESYLTEMKAAQRNKLKDNQFGIPSKRKFPLDTASRVKSAIKFFNYADEEDEAELANNIKKAAKKYGVEISVGDNNRLKKYIKESTIIEYTELDNIEAEVAKLQKDIPVEESVDISTRNDIIYPIPDDMKNKREEFFYKNPTDGCYNACVKFDNLPNICRGRSEMVLIKDQKYILLQIKSNKESYRLPGGGWDPDETHQDAAIRETNEEALMEVKDTEQVHEATYIDGIGPVEEWVKKNVPDKSVWWSAYYTEVFVGTYDGKYTGKVDDVDKDDLAQRAKWYPIDEVWDKLYPWHQIAIKQYSMSHSLDIDLPLNESVFVSHKDLEYNLNDWKPGKKNVLFVTGLSGSGKSTKARELTEKYDAINIPLDVFDHNDNHPDIFNRNSFESEEEIQRYRGWLIIGDYLKKYYGGRKVFDWNGNSYYGYDEYLKALSGFVDYVLDLASKNPNILYAMEGIALLVCPNEKIFENPLIVKGTSMIISSWRKNKRDNDFNIIDILTYPKTLASYMQWFMSLEHNKKEFLKNLKYATEAMSYIKDESEEPMYFYHLMDRTAKIGRDGIITLEYMYRNNKHDLFLKSTEKYRDRLCNAWGIYPDKDPASLTIDEIYKGLKAYRKVDKLNQVYMFKYPPYKDLGHNMENILKNKKVYKVNIHDPKFKDEIESIDWGYVDSDTRNPKLTEKDYTRVWPKDYFANYNDNGTRLPFSYMNHIALSLKHNRIMPKYIMSDNIPADINDIELDYDFTAYNESLKEAEEYINTQEPDHKFRDVIVFDMGSVLVTYKNSKALVMDKIKDIPEELATKMVKYYYDSFDANENASKKNLQDAMKAHFKDENIQDDWVKKVIDICLASAEPFDYTNDMLDDLREKGYELYYLSNWGEASWTENKKKGNFKFLSKFKNGLVSYQAGFTKPSEDIYNLFLQKFNLNPERCIFYDDKKENVVAADKVGIQGILFNSDSSPAEIGALPNIKVEDQYNTESDAFLSEISNLFTTGDQLIFFGEDAKSSELRRILYTDRIKQRKDLLLLYDKVKKDLPFIKYAFPEMKKYMSRNIYIDTSYYMDIFFKNNKWVLKKGLNLFYDFFNRIVNNKTIDENGYKMKTVVIPVNGWTNNKSDIWNYKKSLNPMSIIYQLLYENGLVKLKKVFGDNDIIFINDTKYFKMNFSVIDQKDAKPLALKFKKFILKMVNNEEFDMEDVDTSADKFQSSEVIRAELVDRIEDKTGVDITANVKKVVDKNSGFKTANDLGSIDKTATKKIDAPEEPVKKSKASLNQKSVPGDKDIENTKDTIARSVVDISGSRQDIDDSIIELDDDRIKDMITNLDTGVAVKRDNKGKNKYIETMDDNLKKKIVNGKTVEEIINTEVTDEEANKPVDLPIATPNEAWKGMKFVNFDKDYNIDKDIILLFKFFATTSVPIVIKDIKAEDNSTSEDRLCLYTVKMRAMPEGKQPHEFTVKLDIPIMEDNRFLLRGNSKSIQSQLFNMPIVKTSKDVAEISTLYHKIRVLRFGNVGRSTSESARFIKAINKYKGRSIKITPGDNHKICDKYELPIDYIDLANYINKIETKKYTFYFNQDEIRNKYKDKIENNSPVVGGSIPIGYDNSKGNIIYYSSSVFEESVTTAILNYLSEDNTEFIDVFNSCTRPTSSMYSRCSIMNTMIPTIVICAYHVGLRDTLNRAKIDYRITDKLDKETRSNPIVDWIKFKDGYIVYTNTYEASILMNGLKGCPTEEFELQYIDNPDMYYEFLDNFGGRIKADGLDNFYDLMIDPITKRYLNHYNLPDNYIDCLIYASNLLVDNRFSKHTNVSTRRVRRYEIITAYTYEVLSSAYGSYNNELKHKKSGTFLVKQSAVIDKVLTSNISSDDSCINALRDVETTNTVTTKGPVGMNQERAYSLDKRTFDDSMTNVVGLSTGFSGNVGIARQNTINSNVNNNGGFINSIDGDTSKMNTVNTCTATEAMIPFGCTHDDPIRTSMSFIQTAKHMVRTEDSDPPLVVNGAEEAMAYMTTNRFAFKAKKDGKVIEFVENSYILVEYKDGTKEYINLKNEIMKNSDGGYYEPLKLTPENGIKVGKKFKANEILAHDKASFSNTVGESDNLAFNAGKLAKVAIINSDEGFEDSGCITERLARELTTKINVKYSVTLDKETNVVAMLKVGDHVEVGDALVTWQTAFDEEEANNLMKLLANNDTNISELGKRTLETEHTGVITDIKMFRTVETSELSDSLKKIVTNYERPIKQEADKLVKQGIGKDKFRPYYKLPCTGKLKKAEDAVVIEYYVEYEDTVGIGDKVVYYSANKAEEKTIIPIGKEPYTDFRPNEPINALISEVSIDRRLVTAIPIVGSLNKLLIELDRSVKDIMGIPYDESKL